MVLELLERLLMCFDSRAKSTVADHASALETVLVLLSLVSRNLFHFGLESQLVRNKVNLLLILLDSQLNCLLELLHLQDGVLLLLLVLMLQLK